jgi:hypothetical protein
LENPRVQFTKQQSYQERIGRQQTKSVEEERNGDPELWNRSGERNLNPPPPPPRSAAPLTTGWIRGEGRRHHRILARNETGHGIKKLEEIEELYQPGGAAGTGTPVVAWTGREREKEWISAARLGESPTVSLHPRPGGGASTHEMATREKFKTVLVCSGGGVFWLFGFGAVQRRTNTQEVGGSFGHDTACSRIRPFLVGLELLNF